MSAPCQHRPTFDTAHAAQAAINNGAVRVDRGWTPVVVSCEQCGRYIVRQEFRRGNETAASAEMRMRECTSKAGYPTEAFARQVAADAEAQRGYPLRVYGPCRWCGRWHLTKKVVAR